VVVKTGDRVANGALGPMIVRATFFRAAGPARDRRKNTGAAPAARDRELGFD